MKYVALYINLVVYICVCVYICIYIDLHCLHFRTTGTFALYLIFLFNMGIMGISFVKCFGLLFVTLIGLFSWLVCYIYFLQNLTIEVQLMDKSSRHLRLVSGMQTTVQNINQQMLNVRTIWLNYLSFFFFLFFYL